MTSHVIKSNGKSYGKNSNEAIVYKDKWLEIIPTITNKGKETAKKPTISILATTASNPHHKYPNQPIWPIMNLGTVHYSGDLKPNSSANLNQSVFVNSNLFSPLNLKDNQTFYFIFHIDEHNKIDELDEIHNYGFVQARYKATNSTSGSILLIRNNQIFSKIPFEYVNDKTSVDIISSGITQRSNNSKNIKKIFSKKGISTTYDIDLSKLPPGIYSIRINNQYLKKIMIP